MLAIATQIVGASEVLNRNLIGGKDLKHGEEALLRLGILFFRGIGKALQNVRRRIRRILPNQTQRGRDDSVVMAQKVIAERKLVLILLIERAAAQRLHRR